MNNNKVSIATKPLVYSAFRYIENKVWNALAEYVDNAVQSFKDHIDILKNINPNGKLRVDIYSIVRKSHNSEYQVFTILL